MHSGVVTQPAGILPPGGTVPGQPRHGMQQSNPVSQLPCEPVPVHALPAFAPCAEPASAPGGPDDALADGAALDDAVGVGCAPASRAPRFASVGVAAAVAADVASPVAAGAPASAGAPVGVQAAPRVVTNESPASRLRMRAC